MPTLHLAFGPHWKLDATGPWTARVGESGPLVFERNGAPHEPGAFARAVYSAPVFNAPVRRLVRFRIECAAPLSHSGEPGHAHCRVLTDGAVAWSEWISANGEQSGCHEAEFTSPGGGHIVVELRAEDVEGSAGPLRIEWSALRLELPGFGEEPEPWPPR